MRKKSNTSLSKDELASLNAETHRDLKLLSFFYYECIMPYRTGIVIKVTPVQMLETLEDFYTKAGEDVPKTNLISAHD